MSTPAAAHTVGFKSPGRGMHFTQGQPLVVFVDAFDSINWAHPITCPNGENPTYPAGGGQASCPSGGTPSGWPQCQVMVDGVLQKDTVTNSVTVPGSTAFNYQGNPNPVDFYRFNLAGLAPGTHQLIARGLFAPPPYSDGATIVTAPMTIVVDALPSGKTTVTLTADVTGTVSWNNVIVVGNGHAVSPSGSLVIKDSLITGVSGVRGSVTDADVEGSIFEDSGRVDLTLGAGAVKMANNEFRANNRLTFDASDPSVPVILNLVGSGSNTKLFQGNRVGAGIMQFAGQKWLIGGDTDAQSNVFIGPRTVLAVSASQSVIRGNYSHHNYRGGWSQGFNFDFAGAASDLLTEHNFIRGGSWPLQSVTGDFRYNVVYGYGHNWLRSLASGTRVHHNLFAPETGGGTLDQGIWTYLGETGISIYNNTFDGGGQSGGFAGPTIQISGGSRVASLRNNLITYSRNQDNGNPGSARVMGDASTYAYLDYNAFYSPDDSNKDNYSVTLPGMTEGTPGFAGHDVNGVNGQLAASPFAGARLVSLDDGSVVDEAALWQRTQTVSSVLAAFRARYMPASSSPVINAGDVQDNDSQGRRTDIGAIDRDGHDLDRLGKFGTPSTDPTPPTVSMAAPAAGATVTGTTTLSASAGDNVGVVGVQFLVDGAAVGVEDTAAPYALAFNTGSLSNGSHTFSARARDATGNATTSAGITATVTNTSADAQAPTVSMTAPTAGAILTGTATLTASASDNVGVVGVQFLVDGAATGAEDTTAPYALGLNTTSLANGTHTFSARARDGAGNKTTSAAIAATVQNSPSSAAYRVNIGGAAVSPFTADQFFSGGTISTTTAPVATTGIANAAPVGVYQSGRYGTFSYTIPGLSSGTSYTVRLHFAEIYWTGVGQRAFNVSLNGAQVLTNFDIVAQAGGANKAVVRDFNATANGLGQIVVQYTTVSDNAFANGIEILGTSGSVADTQAPTVSITAPAAGATLTGTATLTASASDNVGVVGVQFLVDGVATGAEDTTAPYALGLSTATLTNGSHTFSARARDAAGNTRTSAGTVGTISNTQTAGSTPKLLSAAEIQQIATNPVDWSGRKAACDSQLGSLVGPGYAGWDWHDAAVRYATCYVVARFLGDPTAAAYSKKTLALMKVLARHHMYGTPQATQELVALGDGSTRAFNLRMTPATGQAVTVYVTPVSTLPVTYAGATAALVNYFPILKISDSAGGAASYIEDTDYHLAYYNTLQWLAGGNHPVAGARYYVTVADQPFAALPAGAVTVSANQLTLVTAPAANQAVFVSYMGADYEQTGNYMGGVESVKPDGPGYPMRTMNVGLAYAYDLMRQSPDLTPALRQEFYSVLNAEVDWYAQSGYERDGDLGNYFIRGRLTGNLFTAYGTDDDNPRAQDAGAAGLKAVAKNLLLQTYNALDRELPGGYGPQGTYANGTTSDVLQIFSLWKRLTGDDMAARLAWTANVVRASIHGTKPDRLTFYDGGDWNELPAVPLLPAMQAFVQYQPNHAMAPYARQLLADGGSPVPGTMLDYKAGATAFPFSYRADVSGPVYARSDWGTGAVWLSFAAGPIIGDHQHRDQGHFTLQRAADDLVINSGAYGLTETLPYHNTLGFDDRGVGDIVVYPPGQGYWGDAAAITKYQDGGGFVYSQADFTDAYVNNDGVRNAVTRAVRTLVYIRPDLVVVHDQAQTAQTGVKKIFNLNFNAPSLTRSGSVFSATTGQSKVFMRSLVPASPTPAITPVNYNGGTANVSNYQVTVTGSTTSSFLHVFQAASSGRSVMASSAYLSSTDARAQGAEVDSGSQRWVVLSAVSSPVLAGPLTYSLPIACPCAHVVGDLPAGASYQVTVRNSSGAQIQQLQAVTTAGGVLSFATADASAAQVTLTP